MGSSKVYEAKLPEVPQDMAQMRSKLGSWLQQQVGRTAPAWGGTLSPAAPFDLNQLMSQLSSVSGGAGGREMYSAVEPFLKGVMQTGLPTTSSGVYQATLAQTQQGIKDAIAQANQAALVNQTRYGTGAMRQAAEQTQRGMTTWGSNIAQLEAQLQEAAAGRQMAAAQLGEQLAYGQGQLGLGAGQLGLQGLLGAGQLGMGAWQMQQQQAQQEYQAWLARQAEYRPATQLAYGFAQQYPFQAQQPTLGPNPWMQLLLGLMGSGSQVGSAALMGG